MSRDLIACCEGIIILRGDDYSFGDSREQPPLYYSGNQEYSFGNYRPINFCPSCGTKFKDFLNTGLVRANISKTEQYEEEDYPPNNPDFCCAGIEIRVVQNEQYLWEDDFAIYYQPWARRHFFSRSNYTREINEHKEWDFYYCIYCGKKLPTSLLKEWLKIVKDECGIVPETLADEVLSDIPTEFKTNLWWKKRGL